MAKVKKLKKGKKLMPTGHAPSEQDHKCNGKTDKGAQGTDMYGLKKVLGIIAVVIISLVIVIGIKLGNVYDADDTAYEATRSDDKVKVHETDYGWYFNGPSEDNCLIFYPSTMVDEMAYAPLAHMIAAEGMDVCIVKLPLHHPLLGKNKAEGPMEEHSYKNWYIGGHSLGGAVAGQYSSKHPDMFKGLLLLAAYPTEKVDESAYMLLIYGSRDDVMNRGQLRESKEYYPENYYEYEIKDGNFAQFGNFGDMKGDNKAKISAKKQQKETVKVIFDKMVKD